jgi:hypothetical protein
MYVWINGWMCASLTSELPDEFCSYSVSKIVSVIGQYPVDMNVIAPKTGSLQMNPWRQNIDFLENGSQDFD